MPEKPKEPIPLFKGDVASLPSPLTGVTWVLEDFKQFGKMVKEGKPLKPLQHDIIFAYVRHALEQGIVVDPHCAAFVRKELEDRPEALAEADQHLLIRLQKSTTLTAVVATLRAPPAAAPPSEVHTESPFSVDIHIKEMKVALGSLSFDSAVRKANEALMSYGENPDVLNWAAVCYGTRAAKSGSIERRLNDIALSIELFDKCLKALELEEWKAYVGQKMRVIERRTKAVEFQEKIEEHQRKQKK